MGIILLIFASSLFITNRIAERMIRMDAKESSNIIFNQVKDKIDSYYQDVENIINVIIYNPTVIEYLKNDDNYKHLMDYNDVVMVVSNAKSLKKGISSIAFYDKAENIIFSLGNKTFAKPETTKSITFTGILQDIGKKNNYFGINVPVYDLSQEKFGNIIGSCFILMDIKSLDEIIEDALVTEDSRLFLIDGDNRIMTSDECKPGTQVMLSDYEDNKDFILNIATFEYSDWKLVNVIPKHTLYENVNLLQKSNFYTYFMVLVILLLLSVILYCSILVPLHKQVQFMKHYTENSSQRIEVKSNNEMGMLAKNMNHMLDEVNSLAEDLYQSQKHAYEMELERKQIQMYAYQTQINPHFLYNTFECIRAMALYHDIEDIARISEALSVMFRYSVKGDGFATVKEAVAILREYARIVGYRFMDRYEIVFRVDEHLLEQVIPKMMIQPLVENAVFHGLETIITRGTVWIDIHQTDGDDKRMYVKVADNGNGMTEDQLTQVRGNIRQFEMNEAIPNTRHGLGIVNVYRRLSLFYGDEGKFIIESKPGRGTGIMMEFPMDRKWESPGSGK